MFSCVSDMCALGERLCSALTPVVFLQGPTGAAGEPGKSGTQGPIVSWAHFSLFYGFTFALRFFGPTNHSCVLGSL